MFDAKKILDEEFEKLRSIKYWQYVCENHHYIIVEGKYNDKCSKCSAPIVWQNLVDCSETLGLLNHLLILVEMPDEDNESKDIVINPIIGHCKYFTKEWWFTGDAAEDLHTYTKGTTFKEAKELFLDAHKQKGMICDIVFFKEDLVKQNGGGLFNFVVRDPNKRYYLDI